MSNHIHLIAGSTEGFHLSNILRDFKKFTSKEIIRAIRENPSESRKEWMLNRFEFAGKYNKKIKNFKFWQDGNEAKEIHTNSFFDQKLDYIHNNPVKAEIVARPEDYLYSSAGDYSDEKGLLEVEIIH
jgi:REP element-mobilizing transposase RayT